MADEHQHRWIYEANFGKFSGSHYHRFCPECSHSENISKEDWDKQIDQYVKPQATAK
jgi:hypothetical protein